MLGVWSSPSRRKSRSIFLPLLRWAGYRASFVLAISLLTLPLLAEAPPCTTAPSEQLVESLVHLAPGLRSDVVRLALTASRCAAEKGLVRRPYLLTVIDYSRPSTEPRLWVFDVVDRALLYTELVAHGKNSGDNIPTHFSNIEGSLATSLGLFVTADPYIGSNGYSLRLRGLEQGVNDNAWSRAIVMHGAAYVSSAAIASMGRLGRSWGCPAVRQGVAKKLINTLRGGSPVFAYYPDRRWVESSPFLRAALDGRLVAGERPDRNIGSESGSAEAGVSER